jgi:hypothetical protein
MKKLSVLAVLAMASIASANVILSVDSTALIPGGTITFTISSTDNLNYAKYLDIFGSCIINLPVTISSKAGMCASVDASNPADILLTAADFSSAPQPGVHFTITVTALPVIAETITAQLISADYPYPVEMESVVTIIPEPATMVILALGGLLFRRK